MMFEAVYVPYNYAYKTPHKIVLSSMHRGYKGEKRFLGVATMIFFKWLGDVCVRYNFIGSMIPKEGLAQ